MRNVNDFKIFCKTDEIKLAMVEKLFGIENFANATHYSYNQIYQTINSQRGVSMQCAKSYCKQLDKTFNEIFEVRK